jgi:hypothetical protein
MFIETKLNDGTTKPVPVIVSTLQRELAVHKATEGKGYSVTHVRSGFAAARNLRRKRDAINLMLELEQAGDWNFRNPFARKWKGQMASLKALVRGVDRY